jgi:hypothetical protein
MCKGFKSRKSRRDTGGDRRFRIHNSNFKRLINIAASPPVGIRVQYLGWTKQFAGEGPNFAGISNRGCICDCIWVCACANIDLPDWVVLCAIFAN